MNDRSRAAEILRKARNILAERLTELVVLSKCDLLPKEQVEEAVIEWRERLGSGLDGSSRDESRVPTVLAVSSATGEGLDDLRGVILSELSEDVLARPERREAGPAEFEVEHRVYRPVGEGGYSVEREDDGAFRIHGRGVELLFERHDLKNEEALAYLEQRLKEIGAIAALKAAGFEAGNDVRVGEHEFELHP